MLKTHLPVSPGASTEHCGGELSAEGAPSALKLTRMGQPPESSRFSYVVISAGLNQVGRDFNVAACGVGIGALLVRLVHQSPANFALQTWQSDVETGRKTVNIPLLIRVESWWFSDVRANPV